MVSSTRSTKTTAKPGRLPSGEASRSRGDRRCGTRFGYPGIDCRTQAPRFISGRGSSENPSSCPGPATVVGAGARDTVITAGGASVPGLEPRTTVAPTSTPSRGSKRCQRAALLPPSGVSLQVGTLRRPSGLSARAPLTHSTHRGSVSTSCTYMSSKVIYDEDWLAVALASPTESRTFTPIGL